MTLPVKRRCPTNRATAPTFDAKVLLTVRHVPPMGTQMRMILNSYETRTVGCVVMTQGEQRQCGSLATYGPVSTVPESRSLSARKADIALKPPNCPAEPLTPSFATGVLTPCRSSIVGDFWVAFGKSAKCRNGSRLARRSLPIDQGADLDFSAGAENNY